MPESIVELEAKRQDLFAELNKLGDFRRGSIVEVFRRCGKPTCHCAEPNDAGHGPSIRLTHKVKGKTVTEALSTPGSVSKAEREVAEFRKFERITEDLTVVSEKICRRRSVEDALIPQEKKRSKTSSAKSPAKLAK